MRNCISSMRSNKIFMRFSSAFLLAFFLLNVVFVVPPVYSMENYNAPLNLPPVGTLLEKGESYKPALIQGMTIHPENPLLFDFIVTPNDSDLKGSALNQEALRMVKYFLASMTVPDSQMWVNLSPNEPNRIIAEGLGSTVLGQDLLSQDYILKQVTSSLMFPQEEVGRKFWDRIHQRAYEEFGVTDIPMDSYNKVWVVPSKASVYEDGANVYVVDRVLKVMLEEDYLSMSKEYASVSDSQSQPEALEESSSEETKMAEQILREIIIPELEKEVNEGRHFGTLRQVYNAMILAKWYKETLKETILSKVYVDQNKVEGVNNHNPQIKQEIYDQYIRAFKKGVYDIIQEEFDPVANELVARKYFSGGMWGLVNTPVERITGKRGEDVAMAADAADGAVKVGIGLVDVGPDALGPATEKLGNYDIFQKPFDAVVPLMEDGLPRTLLNQSRKKKYTMWDMGEEYMAPGLKQFADWIASGGLGFLSGEYNASLDIMELMSGISISMAYRNHLNVLTGEYEEIDYSQLPNVYPVNVKNKEGELVPFEFPVDYKGNFHQEEYGKRYMARAYIVNNDGNPLLLLALPKEADLYHHLYDNFDNDNKRWIQYGMSARMLVELMKSTGVAPDVLRLNEGHMAFMLPAIRNDIEFHRQMGQKSIFEGISIIYTNHTPQYAGIPQSNDIERLRKLVGPAHVPDYMLTDGHFNSLEAMTQCAIDALDNPDKWGNIKLAINGVSQEHFHVILELLLKRFPRANEVVTYVQNSSRAKDWISDRLAAAIEKNGIDKITGEMLLEIAEQHKLELNDGLVDLYGDQAASYYEELSAFLPKLKLLDRWKQYRKTEAYVSLVRWILGDKNRLYTHPEILDINALENPEMLEPVFLNPKWVETYGLDFVGKEADRVETQVRDDIERFIATANEDLIQSIPDMKNLSQWSQYRDTEAYKSLVRWILGEKGRVYLHPEVEDLSALERQEDMEKIFKSPKWVETHGEGQWRNYYEGKRESLSENRLQKLVPQFDHKLLQTRPILAFLRRWVDYKEAGVLIPLIEWIVGDKDKIYKHPEIPDRSVLENPQELEKVLQNPKWVEGPGLEMLMMAGGKGQGEPVGEAWLKQFRAMSERDDLRGRLVVIEDTGFPVMKLAATSTTFLYNVPDPTREASGTSHMRWGLNALKVIATFLAGFSAQIKHGVSGWIVKAFPLKTQSELIQDFNPEDYPRISAAREEFGKRVPVLVSAYLQEGVDLYYHNREKLAEQMLAAFRHAYDTVRMERMVREYETLAISLVEGFGIKGFHEARRKMYLEDLLIKVYRWHPELEEDGTTLANLKTLLREVWSPLDELELGDETLERILASDQSVEDFLKSQGMQNVQIGERPILWYPTKETFTARYLDGIVKKEEADVALVASPQTAVTSYGGINLDSQLLDLQVLRDKDGIPLPLSVQPVADMKVDGFIPIILKVEPYNFSISH